MNLLYVDGIGRLQETIKKIEVTDQGRKKYKQIDFITERSKLTLHTNANQLYKGLQLLPSTMSMYLISGVGSFEPKEDHQEAYYEFNMPALETEYHSGTCRFIALIACSPNFMGDKPSEIIVNENNVPEKVRESQVVGGIQGFTDEMLELYRWLLSQLINKKAKAVWYQE